MFQNVFSIYGVAGNQKHIFSAFSCPIFSKITYEYTRVLYFIPAESDGAIYFYIAAEMKKS